MKITEQVKHRAAELLVKRRGGNPNDPAAVFQALCVIQPLLEMLEAIHDAIEEAEA
jgi:hypothetical protein